MTGNQKEKINQLREEGLGYLRIAKELGISENTVKSYCRRMERTEVTASQPVCEQCGKPIDVSKRPGKRFCSDRCRMRWWNSHPSKPGAHSGHCSFCGREFTMRRKGERKYCSHACYIDDRYHGGTEND